MGAHGAFTLLVCVAYVVNRDIVLSGSVLSTIPLLPSAMRSSMRSECAASWGGVRTPTAPHNQFRILFLVHNA